MSCMALMLFFIIILHIYPFDGRKRAAKAKRVIKRNKKRGEPTTQRSGVGA